MVDATEFSPLGSLDVASLHDGFRGELLRPEGAGYENARSPTTACSLTAI